MSSKSWYCWVLLYPLIFKAGLVALWVTPGPLSQQNLLGVFLHFESVLGQKRAVPLIVWVETLDSQHESYNKVQLLLNNNSIKSQQIWTYFGSWSFLRRVLSFYRLCRHSKVSKMAARWMWRLHTGRHSSYSHTGPPGLMRNDKQNAHKYQWRKRKYNN